MKHLMFILLLILISSSVFSQKNIIGLYKTEDCGNYQVNCFFYVFKQDGSFIYRYSQDVLGEATLTGTYNILGDTIFLNTDNYLFCEQTQIRYSPKTDSSFSTIKIKLLPCHLIGHADTLYVPWLVKINNAPSFLETNENGVLKVENCEISKLEIKDYSMKYDLESKSISDTTIFLTQNNCNIDILLPAKNIAPAVIPPLKKFVIKNKKIIGVETNEFIDYQEFKPSTNVYIKE